jgi:hypothetical protein
MVVSYIHTLSYTELTCIRVVGGYKMPICRAKHEYIQYYLYMLSLPSCNSNTPVTTYNKGGSIKEKCLINFTINGRTMTEWFYITTLGDQNLILGLPGWRSITR